ncbi:diguanylate cyclase [Paraburkholderia caribensis]|uniref:Diguanylate cyclase with PAS/PAC sensor n=2 Tax=Paraburkholderia TaxID=1822464 RepID=B2JY09_PARP8|nr:MULTISPECIES: sensor domain-containing diguanylate cyclase [Paraburkholderia]ACC76517.1 diguanylate cyclase with PAS/PAC sensor [Paraburkholderia phymatum STM815]MCO4880994.1 diguanylate cyclase [Paraburkholderia caribensis]PTB25773.1 sensor domain-containing diguanylate cyclase [Paraburkholderia caribensis]
MPDRRPLLFLEPILATPAIEKNGVTVAIRSSLLSSLFSDQRSLFLSSVASGFVALVALVSLRQLWPALWLLTGMSVVSARLFIAHSYIAASRSSAIHPLRPARRYALLALASSTVLGTGSMACMMSGDAALSALAIMVTAGTLGGVASRNAGVPRLAIAQVGLGAAPIGLGALLAPIHAYWVLVPPLFAYVVAMASIVRRHYSGLVALMTAEQTNAELAARFDAALTHMPHGLCTVDESGKVVIANRRTAELFGATVEMLRLNVPLPEFIGHVSLEKFGETLRKQLVERCTTWLSAGRGPLELELNDGRQLEMTQNPVPDGSAVIIIEDVTERREAEAQMRHWARHDPLTGLPNRRHLGEHLESRLVGAESETNHEPVLALMFLDLDDFKKVNDGLGHHAGDLVLKTVADRLGKTLRQGELVARVGGDELAIVVERATSAACAALAQRIIERLSEPYRLPAGTTATIGASIGIAFSINGESIDLLTERADAALYEAKKVGKGTFRFAATEAAEVDTAITRDDDTNANCCSS